MDLFPPAPPSSIRASPAANGPPSPATRRSNPAQRGHDGLVSDGSAIVNVYRQPHAQKITGSGGKQLPSDKRSVFGQQRRRQGRRRFLEPVRQLGDPRLHVRNQ